MSTEKKKKLTLKQTQFIKHYFEQNGNGTQAAKLAGYKGNNNTLHVVAIENLQKPAIQEAIDKLYKDNGLTEDVLLKKHIQLLNAQREFSIGDVKCKSPDNTVQIAALKLAYEVTGRLIKKIEHSGEIKLSAKERDAHINRIKSLLS